MPTIEVHVPDALWLSMQGAHGEDWSAIANQAFEAHLALRQRTSYESGYAWARDCAQAGDLRAMVAARSQGSAVEVVRGARHFSSRDEFGDHLHPSDEMWEAFVEGATQCYRDRGETG
jgi:hypothetical protein